MRCALMIGLCGVSTAVNACSAETLAPRPAPEITVAATDGCIEFGQSEQLVGRDIQALQRLAMDRAVTVMQVRVTRVEGDQAWFDVEEVARGLHFFKGQSFAIMLDSALPAPPPGPAVLVSQTAIPRGELDGTATWYGLLIPGSVPAELPWIRYYPTERIVEVEVASADIEETEFVAIQVNEDGVNETFTARWPRVDGLTYPEVGSRWIATVGYRDVISALRPNTRAFREQRPVHRGGPRAQSAAAAGESLRTTWRFSGLPLIASTIASGPGCGSTGALVASPEDRRVTKWLRGRAQTVHIHASRWPYVGFIEGQRWISGYEVEPPDTDPSLSCVERFGRNRLDVGIQAAVDLPSDDVFDATIVKWAARDAALSLHQEAMPIPSRDAVETPWSTPVSIATAIQATGELVEMTVVSATVGVSGAQVELHMGSRRDQFAQTHYLAAPCIDPRLLQVGRRWQGLVVSNYSFFSERSFLVAGPLWPADYPVERWLDVITFDDPMFNP